MIKFIRNIGEFFSSNYFDEDFPSKVFAKTGYSSEDIKEFNKRMTPIKDRFFRFKQLYIEGKLRTKDKVFETHQFHTHLLNALGYDGNHTQYNDLFHMSEHEVLPIRHILYRGDQPHLMVMEMQALIKEGDEEPDGLFQQSYNVEEEEVSTPPQRYHRIQWERVFQTPEGVRISPIIINKAISALFLIDPHLRPKYILLLAGNVIFLLEQEKWDRGSYLELDLEELFTEATARATANYPALFYFLVGKETLAPDSEMVLLDQLDEDSHKSAYEVTKDLKEGVIYAVEDLANEALYYLKEVLKEDFDETDDRFEQEMKDDCLRMIYRLLFVFYAESREDLDILPSNDSIYNRGYSLEMLRDLEQVPLYSESSLNGYFFHDSLSKLFNVLSSGYREKENGNNKSFRVRHIDSPFFDDGRLYHLHRVKFRNKVWQDIICRLSLSKQQRNRSRGRISYANLGINQLGSVYESLLAYRGFYAEQDYIEVHKKDKPEDGTYLVPRSRRDDFEEDEILKDEHNEDVILKKGTFVYRLSGRDRQKSASYYTPEVLTQCTVKYTLKPIMERLEKGEMKATELLELKMLEPAMGAAAFQNEMINQVAEAYLDYRQKELREMGRVNWKVEPDKYREELQKVKAYIATNNVYGVDLNPTAVELGKLSLWLNVIHKEMETPFFSNRICVGNAVIGAWLRVYDEKDLSEEYEIVKNNSGKPKRVLIKKEWWNKAPKQLEFKPNPNHDRIRTNRKRNEIYHFLLPDKNMVPSAGIRMLKDDHDAQAKAVTRWRNDFTKPFGKRDLERLTLISEKIDQLLAEYYRFQKMINNKTTSRQKVFESTVRQMEAELQTYEEKERLSDERFRHNAPYFKLKMVMDYWCSLWFWDMRDAVQLPSRQQFLTDIENILDLDINKALDGVIEKRGQQKLFETDTQLSLAMEPEGREIKDTFADAVTHGASRKDLFDENQRLVLVRQLAEKFFFFHPQLEFLEVFWERGGFDLIAGNPPWIRIEFEEKNIISETFPELIIRSISAPNVRRIRSSFLSSIGQKREYINEYIANDSFAAFSNNAQLYFLLKGQQSDLYKNILVNNISSLNPKGHLGFVHPLSVFDEAKGGALRGKAYQQLNYVFHFRNEFGLFQETNDKGRLTFSVSVYSGEKTQPDFKLISNVFHPSTIDGCFIPNSNGPQSIKIKKSDGNYDWNTFSNNNRIVHYNNNLLKTLGNAQGTDDLSPKLIYFQSNELVRILEKFGNLEGKRILETDVFFSRCFDETNDVGEDKALIDINQNTKKPDLGKYEMVYNGPHFTLLNPVAQTPKKYYNSNNDYQTVNPLLMDESFLPNTKYLINSKLSFTPKLLKFGGKNWFESYRWVTRGMVGSNSERTLQVCIIPPKAIHINGVLSLLFKNDEELLSFTALTSSIIMDFYVKINGWTNIHPNSVEKFPISIGGEKEHNDLICRVLLSNCLTEPFSKLWKQHWKESFKDCIWSKKDPRLKPFKDLSEFWQGSTPLRNWFERRQALVEIDVITAMAMGINLEELLLIYNLQFPVLQQNEDDTWYDTKGNIVFTCSKGLTGVGVDRPVWEQIRHMKAGETYEHTITKSELYKGKKVIYHAPFDKCDRVEDYKVAWAHFENIFNQTK